MSNAQTRSKTPQKRSEQSTQRDDAMKSLREEITTLKAENARLTQRLDEAIKLLENAQRSKSHDHNRRDNYNGDKAKSHSRHH